MYSAHETARTPGAHLCRFALILVVFAAPPALSGWPARRTTAERIVEHQSVIVRDGIIAETGSADWVQPPEDAVYIEGAGRYLMPR